MHSFLRHTGNLSPVRFFSFRWFFGSRELTVSNDLGLSVGQEDDFSSSISFPVLQTRHNRQQNVSYISLL